MTEKYNIFSILEEISEINLKSDLNRFKAKYTGKDGFFVKYMKELLKDKQKNITTIKKLDKDKKIIHQTIQERSYTFSPTKMNKQKVTTEKIDISLKGIGNSLGSLHPINQTIYSIKNFFKTFGFRIVDGKEIETTYYNFGALNIEENHPARNKTDTFYIDSENILRTHTSGVQIRTLEKFSPPLRIISPGKVYRKDADMTHSPMFHQIEGLCVEEKLSFAYLKSILNLFLESFFNKKLKTRFRPYFFPFTEPSAEQDMQCIQCSGDGCLVCSGTGWIEVLGCGIVRSSILKSHNINIGKYLGIAFGLGVERLAMIKYGISDLRIFFENDLRFLKQF